MTGANPKSFKRGTLRIILFANFANLRVFREEYGAACAEGNLSTSHGSETVFVDLQRADLRFKSGGRNAELGCRPRGSRYSASGVSQGSLNYLFLLRHRPL